MNAEEISRREKHSRCVALEEDYVHQVYEKIGKDLIHAKDPLAEKVQNFLDDLEPGSLVADIGCGDGRHLRIKDAIFSLGADSSCLQTSLTRQRCQEVVLGDNLSLPFRDNSFDAVLSVGVIHHFTTRERRIKALKELSRILRIGGRIFVAVQKNNTQNSQDVLIPWFDVPKDKNKKDKCWLEQDSGEYELEDEENYDDDDDDDDSISLPSSDEDDTPWTTNAKFFPPHTQCDAKHKWSSERRWRSLESDSRASSSSVPNSTQLVQTNACYAFVRNALKKFSSVNSSDEEVCFKSDFYNRVDSAVPPSPTNGQEEKLDYSNNSSLNLNESVQMTINENFIELLNIDDGPDTSNFHHGRGGAHDSFLHFKDKPESYSRKNKSTLIRSVSDILRNMNSLWSSKGTKSCSDLKSQTIIEDSTFGRMEQDSRLTRSKTTASCKYEIDFFSSLEDIEEIEMTLSEANKIINDFLESSGSSLQSLDMSDEETNELFAPLTQSDIVNGNTLTFPEDSVRYRNFEKKVQDFSSNYKCKDNTKYHYFEDERPIFEKPRQQFDLRKETLRKNIIKLGKSQAFESSIFPCDFQCEVHFNRSDSVVFTDSDSDDALSDISDALYLDEISCNYQGTLDQRKADDMDIDSTDESTSFSTRGESAALSRKLSPEMIKVFEFEKLDKNPSFSALSEFPYDRNERNFGESLRARSKLTNADEGGNVVKERSALQRSNESSVVINESSVNNNCLIHGSPKKIRKLTPNCKSQMSGSKTLGPFYDEDEDYLCGDDSATLSSYYSMPELHAISDFYFEYLIYQTNCMNDTTTEMSNKFQEKYHLKKENSSTTIYPTESVSKIEDNLNISKKCNIYHSNSECSSHKATIGSSVCVTDKEQDLKVSVNSNLTQYNSDLCLNKFKINSLSNRSLYNDEIDRLVLFSSNICNRNHPVCFKGNNKWKSLNSFHNQNYNALYSSNPLIACNKVSRSQSIGAVPDYLISKNTEDLHSCFLSASQHSLMRSCAKETSFNINKLKLSENNISLDKSNSLIYEENTVTNSFVKVIPVLEEIYQTPDNCAFNQIKASCRNSTPNCRSMKRKMSCSNCFSKENSSMSVEENNYSTLEETISIPNCEISLNSKINLPDFKTDTASQFEIVCDNSHEHIYATQEFADIEPTFKTQAILEDPVICSNSYKEIKCEKHSDTSSTFSSNEVLGSNYFHDSSISNKELNDTVEHCNIDVTNSETYSQDYELNKFPDIKTEATQNEITKCSAVNFSSKNISLNTLTTQSHESLVCSINNNEDGAIKYVNTELPREENFADTTFNVVQTSKVSNVVTDTELTLKSQESTARFSEQQHMEEKGDQQVRHSSDVSYQESINYAYGRIHEEGAIVVGHRYHHLFEEEELDDLIENNISDLHVLSSFHHESHWCIIAEKVRVWNI